MKAFEIREAFLAYFERNGHTRVKSSSLIPANDPTLFFTNAGMIQFKEVFTGEESRPYKRACSSQKCIRVSGKHNDLEVVGHTPRHHTFFEMLGNFSFGDYFKKEAIAYGWEFLTKDMGLDPNRLYVTIFEDDDEAEKLWLAHLPKDRIFRRGEKDNFWAMGDTGPCGPCSEIIWGFESAPINAADLDTDRFMEIWNLVFMQFNRLADGKMVPLAAPSIDTGLGLERLAAVMQGVRSNWETDLFIPIIAKVAKVCKVEPGKSPEVDTSLRVIADHIRGSAFLIGDGVIPSNEGRGYVLRRILRRAIRYGKRLGRDEPFLASIAHVVVDSMGSVYPELAIHQRFIERVMDSEDRRFYQTLDKGLELLKAEMKRAKKKVIPGQVAFSLYDTYGFPLDVTQLIAAEKGFHVDEKGFGALMEKQRERARASWKGTGEEAVAGVFKDLAAAGIRTDFVGYSDNSAEASVLAIIVDGKPVDEAKQGQQVQLVASPTPFYGEAGGQVGDVGLAVAEGLEVEITDAKRPLPDLIVHVGRVKQGRLAKGTKITLAIDADARQLTRCNHTATHLLHMALRRVLGEHVKQAGSLVAPSRFRFDFSHFQAMTAEELAEVQRIVNEAIRNNYPVMTYDLTYDEALSQGALAFFGEKYAERVRMLDISGLSRELCGGTHVSSTGEIGMFKIIAESSVAAGVRRIEGVTGIGVERYIDDLERQRTEIAKAVRAQPAEVVERIRRLTEQTFKLERELKKARSGAVARDLKDLKKQVKEVEGVKVLVDTVDAPDRKTLGEWAERYRDKPGAEVVVLGSIINDKVAVSGVVAKNVVTRAHAGNIVSKVSEIVGGKGGGRPDFAQGGGTDTKRYAQFKKEALKVVEKELEGFRKKAKIARKQRSAKRKSK